jgi:class 3 adenylate cyclase/tetratricopeptide (TPR) repeat protein
MLCESCQHENHEALSFCERCGSALPSTAFSGERRQLTVLFADLANSSTLSEQLDAEDYQDLIHAYQTASVGAVTRFGGYVAQYLGDGVLVYFGYPEAFEDAARFAVQAGLELVHAVAALNSPRWPGRSIAARVGIATGMVVAAPTAPGSGAQTLAFGQTPNIAARLQGEAAPGGVVLSSDTYSLVDGFFEFESLGERKLKGVAHSMKLYRPIRSRPVRNRFDIALGRGLSAFQGRAKELTQLAAALEHAKRGLYAVSLCGEAGVGKSRLVHELRRTVLEQEVCWLQCSCSPTAEATPLSAVIDAVAILAGLLPEDDDNQKLDRLERLAAICDLDPGEAIPTLASLLAINVGDRYAPPGGDANEQRERTLSLLAELLAGASRHYRQMCFCIEDLHWVDPSTLDVLARLRSLASKAPLLVVTTFRPQFNAASLAVLEPDALDLQRLPPEAVVAIAQDIAGSHILPREVLEAVVAQTDGVPLFVEEWTKSLLESGALRIENKRYELAGRLDELHVPRTLQDSLTARLDRLGSARAVAQVAAVIGREFDVPTLSNVAEMEPEHLTSELARLCDAGLLRRDEGEGRYSFTHALLGEAAYTTLLKRVRRRLHARTAAAVLEMHPALTEARPELIAHHLTEAGDTVLAIEYWRRAAQHAMDRSAFLEASHHVRRGLQLLRELAEGPERDESELALQLVAGPVFVRTAGYAGPAVEQAYVRAFELCEKLGQSGQGSESVRRMGEQFQYASEFMLPGVGGQSPEAQKVFWVLWGLGAHHQSRGEHSNALAKAEHLLRRAVGDPALMLEAHFGAGSTQYMMGGLAGAQKHLAAGVECYRSLDRRLNTSPPGHHPEVLCASYLALTLWHLGFIEKAFSSSDEAIALARESDHPFSLGGALTSRAWMEQMHGDVQAARSSAAQALEIGEQFAIPVLQAFGGPVLAWATAKTSAPEAAAAELEKGLEQYRQQGYGAMQTYFLGLLAECWLLAGRWNDALSTVEVAQRCAIATGERAWEPELHRLRGELRLRLTPNDRQGAERSFNLGLVVARRQRARSMELRVLSSMARAWGASDSATVLRELAKCVAWFPRSLHTPALDEARELLSPRGSTEALAS